MKLEHLSRIVKSLRDMRDRANTARGSSWEHGALSATILDDAANLLEESDARLHAVRVLLENNGCECECVHYWEDHDDDCERCLACRIEEAVQKDVSAGQKTGR